MLCRLCRLGDSRRSHSASVPSTVAANARPALYGSKQQHVGVDSQAVGQQPRKYKMGGEIIREQERVRTPNVDGGKR